MEQNPIRYQDLISPDDSIEKLIGQLEQLNNVYTGMANEVKTQAQGIASSLKNISGATAEGRKATKDASDEAKRLEKAYKALDAALATNAKEIAKLNIVRREANNYNKQMVLRGNEEIKTRKQIAEASYQQLSAQYSLNKAYINTLNATDRQVKANKELIQTTKEIYEQMKRLQADTGKMQLNVGNYPSMAIDTKAIMSSLIGVTSAAGGVVMAINQLKQGVGVAMDYEKALSGLAAILGTTTDQLGELAKQSRDLGATTIYTAKEVAELQTELAKLGYTTSEITKMTPGVLSFAQATGSSLADAASLAGAALRMFEKDAISTQDFVDKMTLSTTKSALSFGYLNNALSTVGSVANMFGFKLEDVLALLGQLANAGFDASSAATATRNIILNLADGSKALAQALGEPVRDLDGLISGLNKLNAEGIDLAGTLELTDRRSVAAFNTFLKGTDNVIEMRDALLEANGAAEQMAKTMADNLEGDIKSLQSAWEDFMIEINNGQGIMRGAIQELTELVRDVSYVWRTVKGYFDDMTESMGVFSWYVEQVKATMDRVFNHTILGKVREIWRAIRGARQADAEGSQEETPTFDIYRPLDDDTHVEPTKTKTKTKTKEEKAAEKAAAAAAKKRLQEQEQMQKRSLELQRAYEDAVIESYADEAVRERAKIIAQYDRKIEDLKIQLTKEKNLTVADRENINNTILQLEEAKNVKLADLVNKGAEKEKQAREKAEREAEQQRNQSLRKQEQSIRAEYENVMDEIDMLETSEKEKTRMRLEAEKERLQKLLALYEADGKKLTEAELASIKSQMAAIDKELERNKKRGDIYDMLGLKLTDEQKEAVDAAFSYAMENLSSYLDAWLDAAQKKREAADKEVESTKSVLDSEIEARNKGYAANVALAQKEYDEAKKNQQKAIQEEKKAKQAQDAIKEAEQAINLVTASTLIWRQLGFPWAIPAIAVMWGSFAAAKLKAAQVTKASSEQYGEGTVELLQGGSHQSGNDIDLGRKKDGTRRRAEGGEYFAVINKRNSRKYRGIIPDVINSLNQGTFAQKYLNAYDGGGMMVEVQGDSPDLRGLSSDVRSIREQGESRIYVDGQGRTVILYKNVKRTILN